MDFDAIGGAATGGLIASTFENPTGNSGEAHTQCCDCGAEVTGRFCSNCGQAAHVHRTVLHLGEELLHGVMHFDSRAWRTLPMLVFRPGTLTRGWVHGQRTRYVSPLAIFLFTVFVMFMALSYLPNPQGQMATQQVAAGASLARHRTELANAEAALSKARTPDARSEAEGAIRQARTDIKEVTSDLKGMQNVGKASTNWKERLAADARSGELKINTGDKKLDGSLRHKLENPDLAIYKLQQTFYKFSFLLAPISIPFMALLFVWKRGFTLYDHGVFVLYSLTFVSLLVMVIAGASRLSAIAGAVAVSILPFVVSTHMFFQLKGAYGLGWWSALWRTALLLTFCVIALVLFLAAIAWLLGRG